MSQTVRGVISRRKGDPVEVVDVVIPDPGPGAGDYRGVRRDEARVEAIHRNVTHGLLLTLGERTAAARDLLTRNATWSDRFLADSHQGTDRLLELALLNQELRMLEPLLLDVDAELEDDERLRQPLARIRADAVDAVERRDGVLDGARDQRLDLARRRARVRHVDDDHREGAARRGLQLRCRSWPPQEAEHGQAERDRAR